MVHLWVISNYLSNNEGWPTTLHDFIAVDEQGDQVLDLTDSEAGDMDNGPFETPLN